MEPPRTYPNVRPSVTPGQVLQSFLTEYGQKVDKYPDKNGYRGAVPEADKHETGKQGQDLL